jgi:hypothetical protein
MILPLLPDNNPAIAERPSSKPAAAAVPACKKLLLFIGVICWIGRYKISLTFRTTVLVQRLNHIIDSAHVTGLQAAIINSDRCVWTGSFGLKQDLRVISNALIISKIRSGSTDITFHQLSDLFCGQFQPAYIDPGLISGCANDEVATVLMGPDRPFSDLVPINITIFFSGDM